MAKVSEIVSSKIGDTITNVQTWSTVMYNVNQHDLVGDGSTDDTTALQTLVDLAISESRKAIFFPNGTYKVTALTDDDQVVFLGDNASFTGGYAGTIHQLGEISTDEIETAMIEDLAVTTDKLAANAVTAAKVAADVATQAELDAVSTVANAALPKAGGTMSGDIDMNGNDVQNVGFLNLSAGASLTIATGAITVTDSFHVVDTEAMAATDDLDTINGGPDLTVLFLRQANAGRDVTIKSGTGNIHTITGEDVRMEGSTSAIMLLRLNSTVWCVPGIQGLPLTAGSNYPLTGDLDMGGNDVTNAGNLPDGYEEGTFTPALNFGGAAVGITYSQQNGRYTKIGRTIMFELEIILTSKGSSTGNATIGGLPVASSVNRPPFHFAIGRYISITFPASVSALGLGLANNSTSLSVNGYGDAITAAAVDDTHFVDTSAIQMVGHYTV